MRKLKSKVLKLLSTLLVLTLVLVPFTTNVDAETSTKTSSLPIYCYSRYGGKNITVYTQTNTSSPVQGEITPDKYIKIVNMNTSGWAKVTYPTEQGNKTGYFLLKTLFINPNFSDKWVYLKGATKSTYTVYRKYLLRTKFGTIAGDSPVKIIGTDKGNTQILYQRRGGGYYLGWIKGEWSPTSIKPKISTRTSSLPIYCYSRYGGKNITVYTKTNLSSEIQGVITPDKYIKIVNMNTSGWAKVTYPTEQGNKTGYFILDTLFINPKFSDKWGYLKGATQSTYTVYRKYLLRTKFGKIKGDDRVKIIGTDKGNTQILYERSGGGYYLGWIKGEWSLTSTKPKIPTSKVDKVLKLAEQQLGKPYVKGGNGPNSFDCSGLTKYVYKKAAGITLPRTSIAQSNYGTTVSKSNLKAGDLLFFDTNEKDNKRKVTHVGIYVGNGKMIHAPKTGDVVKKVNINTSYWNPKYIRAKRVL